jgi:hypothetical protein
MAATYSAGLKPVEPDMRRRRRRKHEARHRSDLIKPAEIRFAELLARKAEKMKGEHV